MFTVTDYTGEIIKFTLLVPFNFLLLCTPRKLRNKEHVNINAFTVFHDCCEAALTDTWYLSRKTQ